MAISKNNLVSILIVGAISIALGIWTARQTIKQPAPRGYPNLGGDFTLQSANGPLSLHDFHGKAVALYFGYTSCPDVCPTTMALLGNAFKQLNAEEQKKIQGILISVDPERDSVEKLAEYVKYFYPDFIGLTGSIDELTAIAQRYGILFAKVEDNQSAAGYTVDHSSTVFIINEQGVVESLLPHGSSKKDMLEQIRKVLAQF